MTCKEAKAAIKPLEELVSELSLIQDSLGRKLYEIRGLIYESGMYDCPCTMIVDEVLQRFENFDEDIERYYTYLREKASYYKNVVEMLECCCQEQFK